MDPRHRVVIVGGGFGGLYAAQALAKVPVDVTLLDRRNFHLFQPLLYQVATGGLSPVNFGWLGCTVTLSILGVANAVAATPSASTRNIFRVTGYLPSRRA